MLLGKDALHNPRFVVSSNLFFPQSRYDFYLLMLPITVCLIQSFFRYFLLDRFKPSTPPVMPTPEVLLQATIATRTEIVYCVPAFIEVGARMA